MPASLKKGESFGLLLPFMTTTASTEAVRRDLDALGRLADGHGAHDARRLRLEIDDAHGVGVAAAPAMLATAAKAPFEAMSMP